MARMNRNDGMNQSTKTNSNTSNNLYLSSLNVVVKRFLAYFWDSLLDCLQIGLNARFSYQAVVHMLDQVNTTYIGSLCCLLHCDSKQTFGQMQSVITK